MDTNPQPTPSSDPTPPQDPTPPAPETPPTPNISSTPEEVTVSEPETTETNAPAAAEEPAAPDATVTPGPETTEKKESSSLSQTLAPMGSQDPGFPFGLASLILALLGLGLFSVILGILALKKSKKAGYTNGLAIAGIIIGALEVFIGLLVVILLVTTLPAIISAGS